MRLGWLRHIFPSGTNVYLVLSNNVRFYPLTVAVTADTTETTAPAGSLAVTSHATGRGIVFYSDGSKWQAAAGGEGGGGGGSFVLATPTGDADGENLEFVFASAPIFVEVNGQIVHVTEDYTLATATVTFLVAPPNGAIVRGLVASA